MCQRALFGRSIVGVHGTYGGTALAEQTTSEGEVYCIPKRLSLSSRVRWKPDMGRNSSITSFVRSRSSWSLLAPLPRQSFCAARELGHLLSLPSVR